MAIVQLIDPQSGTVYNVEDKEAALAMDKNGLQLATPEQVADYDAAKASKEKNESFGAQVVTGIEEAGRRIFSGAAGAARFATSMGGEVDAMGNPIALTEPALDVKGSDIAPNLYTKSALERRKLNPTAADIGGAAVTAPLYATGPVGTVAADALNAYSQEAVDAELEGRGIDGSTILANGALNLALSGLSYGAPIALNKAVKGAGNTAQRVVNWAESKVKKGAQASIDSRMEGHITAVDDLIKDPSMYPDALNTPKAQKQAIENVVDYVSKIEPQDADFIRTAGFESHTPGSKGLYYDLNQIKDQLSSPEAIKAVDDLLQSKELWGENIINHYNLVQKLPGMRPGPGSPPEQYINYIRTIHELGPKFERVARGMEQVAEDKLMVSLEDLAQADGVVKWIAKKSAGTVAKLAAMTAGGMTSGPIGVMVGREVEGAFKESFEPVVENALAKGLFALQQASKNDSFRTARLMVNPQLVAPYVRLGLAGGKAAFAPEELFRGEYDSDVQAYQAHRKVLKDFKSDPMSLINTLSDEFGDVDQQAPRLYKSMVEQALKVSNFLQEKLPPARSVSMVRPEGTPPSPMQIRTWALYYTAATDPQSVLESAKVGKLRKEQIETLKALWPNQYNELREAVIENLASSRPNTTTRQRLNILFGFGNALEPALDPALRDKTAMARSQNQDTRRAPAMKASTPPSKAGLTPGGMSALQLGPSLDQKV